MTPDYAYIPGQTPRHREDAFDAIRDTAVLGMSVAQLAQSAAFVTGLRFLDTGYYWEAHEVLEPVWMALPQDSDGRIFVQALIQLANGRLKMRMARPKASIRLAGMARALLVRVPGAFEMQVSCHHVHAWIDSLEWDAKHEV